jgi:purine-binding chemotaxis protein CheW
MVEEQLVVFLLGKEEYAVSIAQVKEIIQYKGATKLPNTPAYMEGIINLRGKVIPVIELAMRFGVVASSTINRRVVIVETAGQEIGIVVDEVTEVIRLQEAAIEPVPTMSASNDYVRGIGKDNNRLLIVLDLSKLFGKGEIEAIQSCKIA